MSIRKFWDKKARALSQQKSINLLQIFADITKPIYKKLLCETVRSSTKFGAILKTDLWEEGVDKSRGDLQELLSPVEGKLRLLGLDVSPIVCKLANKKSGKSIDILCSELSYLPIRDNSCKVVFDFSTLDHIPPHDVPRVLAEYKRILKRGGVLIVVYDSSCSLTKIELKLLKIFRVQTFDPFTFLINSNYLISLLNFLGLKIKREVGIAFAAVLLQAITRRMLISLCVSFPKWLCEKRIVIAEKS